MLTIRNAGEVADDVAVLYGWASSDEARAKGAEAVTADRLDFVRRLREMAKGHPDRVYGTIAMAELRALSLAADQLEAEIRKAGG